MNNKLLTKKFMDGGDVSGFYSGVESTDSTPGPGGKAKRARRRARRKSGGAKWKPGCGR